MLRALLIALAVVVSHTQVADAQAFKPRAPAKVEKKAAPRKAAKPRKAAAKPKKKPSRAADSRPVDLTPEPAPKKSAEDDDDYVLIVDDDA